MPDKMSRREFLHAAGGITFLALAPSAIGLPISSRRWAAEDRSLPLFTALPYVQPGDNSKLIESMEAIIVAWQTERRPADFELTYGPTRDYGRTAHLDQNERRPGADDEQEPHYNYAAALTGLDLSKRYYYRVRGNGQTIVEGYFTTRKRRGERVRFVAFGDNAYGEVAERAIAYYAYQSHPDFVMNTGDNVYESGLDNEYARYFFPVYNAPVARPDIGAPILSTIPYYTVIANHDVHHKDANGHPIANFDRDRDALAYYTNMHLPLNGPAAPPQLTPIMGEEERIAEFKRSAGARYPRMANYSFDYGDAHLLCLDSNVYVDPTNHDLQAWIESDLSGTDALWKIVVFHHPAYNVGNEHYSEQHMRALSPLLEKHGVDFVLNGHEHTYQRTMPLRFEPTSLTGAAHIHGKDRHVPGKFTLDHAFDGRTHTLPEGVIYIVTGAGGKHLYDLGFDNDPTKWLHPEDDNTAYTARFVSDSHSLTVIDLDGKSAILRQVDEHGAEVDRIRITKS